MKYNKKIIVSIFICLICILLILVCILNMKKREQEQENITNEALSNMTIPNGLENVYPSNTIALSQKYKGDLEMKEISKSVSKFITATVKFLKEKTMDMSDEEIIEYYNNHSFFIESRIGDLTDTQFLNLVKYIQKLNNSELEYESSEYEKESIQVDGKKLEAKLTVKYKEEEKIEIKVSISTGEIPITFTCYE